MVSKDYKFDYYLHDGSAYGARWEGDILSMTFFRYYIDENTPNIIEVRFHGVTWIRSTNYDNYPDDYYDEEGMGTHCYDPKRPIDSYLLLDRDLFNDNYEDFVLFGVDGDLDTVRCLEDNIVFVDDMIIFSCNEIEIVRAICEPDCRGALIKFWDEFNKKYNRKPKIDFFRD